MNTLPNWLVPVGLGVLLLIFLASTVGTYNGMIAKREEAVTQASNIQVDMQRRADLVPNVVSATKGGMKQEQAVFDKISKAYASFQNAPSGSTEKLQAGDSLGAALRGYMVVVQQYPNLKSLDLIKDLNVTLEGTENRIAVARTRYNEAVQIYNRDIQTFPNNAIAGMFGFQRMDRFESDSKGKKTPSVDLGF